MDAILSLSEIRKRINAPRFDSFRHNRVQSTSRNVLRSADRIAARFQRQFRISVSSREYFYWRRRHGSEVLSQEIRAVSKTAEEYEWLAGAFFQSTSQKTVFILHTNIVSPITFQGNRHIATQQESDTYA